MTEKAFIEINSNAVRENILTFKKFIPRKQTLVMAIIKGNAYGMGIKNIISSCDNLVDWYGVDSYEEAVEARSHTSKPILILGFVLANQIKQSVAQDFNVCLYAKEQFFLYTKELAGTNLQLKVHIEFDSGLKRLGANSVECMELIKLMKNNPNIGFEGLFTHFAKVLDGNDNFLIDEKVVDFDDLIKNLGQYQPKIIHASSSLPSLGSTKTHYSMVRLGIPMYGLWGSLQTEKLVSKILKSDLSLKPIFEWKSIVVNTQKILRGSTFGYKEDLVVGGDTHIAILGLGFYDGLDRRYKNGGSVLIRGKRAPILNIYMNMCSVDISNIPNVVIGDEAIIIGGGIDDEITLYEMAQKIGTSTYEILVKIGQHIPRFFKKQYD